MKLKTIMALGSTVCLVSATAQATVVGLVYDTGVDNAGASLPSGMDSHYMLGTGPATVVTAPNGAWLADAPANGNSRWISGAANGGGGPDANYVFTTIFSMPNAFSSAVLSGLASSDNDTAIYLNGNLIGNVPWGVSGPPYSFQQYSPFSATAGFLAGPNTLTFDVHNGYIPAQGGDAGPFGLRVQGLNVSYTAVPEPMTVLAGALLLLPFGASTLRVLRRKA